MHTLAGHSASVDAVALTADGRRAVSASDDGTLRVWDLASGAALAGFTCDDAGRSCLFAGPDEVLAGDVAGRVYLLRLGDEGEELSHIHYSRMPIQAFRKGRLVS